MLYVNVILTLTV